ncbi:hypothetical protein [Kitasatospora sp. NPDC001225]
MALARKGTRRIAVDGEEYRWRVTRQHWCCDYEGTTLGYAAEHAAHPGTALVVDTGRPTLRTPGAVATDLVLPREVAAGIRTARANGWTPATPGPPLTLHLSAA